jgi:hypothetical protein
MQTPAVPYRYKACLTSSLQGTMLCVYHIELQKCILQLVINTYMQRRVQGWSNGADAREQVVRSSLTSQGTSLNQKKHQITRCRDSETNFVRNNWVVINVTEKIVFLGL